MAGIHEIKQRIKSIKETMQITKAMKLISAAKLKKARTQLEQTLPYFEKVKKTMADILIRSEGLNHPFFDLRHDKEGKKKGYLIFTGDKGLAGSYNHNIIKLAEEKIAGNADALLFVAGQVGKSYFVRNNYNVYEGFEHIVQNPTIYRARDISEMILELYKNGDVDEVHLIYTMVISSMNLEPHSMKLLPLDPKALGEDLKKEYQLIDDVDDSIIYEPSEEAVLDVLVYKYVKGVIYGALVEAFASEQSARMSAMDNATTNAEEMLDELRLSYNRARQAKITREISEIVGGAAVLEK